ncbi:hypothetical protein AAF712_016049 [Marasmius tenuissimus]|uniref:Uncharacterized protein n=1 Tax=Marasmius tenuissimus TaxID=585030 RepID=A0ABR2Z6P5_9AGAR
MPRPKLYRTKAERREANRAKNKRFYNRYISVLSSGSDSEIVLRNRKEILRLKQDKRDEENRAFERESTRIRKKRKAEREKQDSRKPQDKVKDPVSTLQSAVSEGLNLCINELERKVEDLKERHRRMVKPDQGHFCANLCQRAVLWKRATRKPLMQQSTSINPIVSVQKAVEANLQEYQAIEDEYFYATRELMGRRWDEKRELITLYKEVVSEFSGVLDKLFCGLNKAGFDVKLDDLSPIYLNVYGPLV